MIGLPQRQVGQPYTMCHALRLVDPAVDCGRLATPAFGTNYALDHPEVLIKLCLTAPRQVQLAARLQGVQGVVHIRVPGLKEALERSRSGREPRWIRQANRLSEQIRGEKSDGS